MDIFIPANFFNNASNIIFAPFTGTAIPICFLTLSFDPLKIKLSGNVCNLALSLFG